MRSFGKALLFNDMNKSRQSGELEEVLKDWRHTYEPFYLYYPHRREQAPLLNILITALKENFDNKSALV